MGGGWKTGLGLVGCWTEGRGGERIKEEEKEYVGEEGGKRGIVIKRVKRRGKDLKRGRRE